MKDILWFIIVVLSVSIIMFHVANAEAHNAMVENCGEEPVKANPLPHPGPAP